jgi:hypothetical protein
VAVVAVGLAARASVPPTALERVRSDTARRELRAEVDLPQTAVLKGIALMTAAIVQIIAATISVIVEMIGLTIGRRP